jgi:hypothetical protein
MHLILVRPEYLFHRYCQGKIHCRLAKESKFLIKVYIIDRLLSFFDAAHAIVPSGLSGNHGPVKRSCTLAPHVVIPDMKSSGDFMARTAPQDFR